MEANRISLKTFSSSLAAVLLIETGFRMVFSARIAASLPALGLVRGLESILLVVMVWSLEKDSGAIGLSLRKIPAGIMKGLIWSACFGMAAAVLYLAFMATGIDVLEFLRRTRPPARQQMFVFFLVGGVIGPIAEEIFFRGIVYGFLRRWGATLAVILSTLIFVFTHPQGGTLPVTQLVGGIVFAIAYEREQNLMVPITIHCLGNLAIFSLTMLI